MNIGMKILGQIISVQPLALIISLPNQLFAHVPITNISSQLTSVLDSMAEDDDVAESDEDMEALTPKSGIPDLVDIFRPGQYVRAVVTAVHAPGSTNVSGVGKSRDEVTRASRRVELSLVPATVNAGVKKSDLKAGFVRTSLDNAALASRLLLHFYQTLSAAIKSVEDHGYILDLGVPDVSAFLSFNDTKKGPFDEKAKLHLGRLLDVTVVKMSGNGRTCNVGVDPATFSSSSVRADDPSYIILKSNGTLM